MSRCRLPILYPLFPNAVGSLDKPVARALPVLDYNHDPGVKFSLLVINIGQAGPFGGNHILNCNFHSSRSEYWASVRVHTDSREVLQDKKIRHLWGRDQSHQVQVEIGITRCRREEAVTELREGSIEVVLPDAASES